MCGRIDDIWKVRHPGGSLKAIDSDIRRRIAETPNSERKGRFRRFSLYFYLDRISGTGVIDVDARENMMELEPDLFRLYLKKIEETQSELIF